MAHVFVRLGDNLIEHYSPHSADKLKLKKVGGPPLRPFLEWVGPILGTVPKSLKSSRDRRTQK
jgi:hypothetical protein